MGVSGIIALPGSYQKDLVENITQCAARKATRTAQTDAEEAISRLYLPHPSAPPCVLSRDITRQNRMIVFSNTTTARTRFESRSTRFSLTEFPWDRQ